MRPGQLVTVKPEIDAAGRFPNPQQKPWPINARGEIITLHRDGVAVSVYWPHRRSTSIWLISELDEVPRS